MMGETAVYLGRFCPFHKGHIKVLKSLIKKFGESGVLVIIGSSRFITDITPYTFEQRKRMILTVFPNLTIIPLPDTSNKPKYLGDPNNNKWLSRISKIEKRMKTKFVFYGGSKRDLEILALKFPTKVIVDRFTKGKNISGTMIREIIKRNDLKALSKFIDKRILRIVTG